MTGAESPNAKRLEKLFKKQLIELEVDKEMLEVKLKNKDRELDQLQMQITVKEVF